MFGIFTKYGGHKSAAGLSLIRENLNKFKDLFEEELVNYQMNYPKTSR